MQVLNTLQPALELKRVANGSRKSEYRAPARSYAPCTMMKIILAMLMKDMHLGCGH